ncbi:toll-like receptor 4 [Diadema setosum]|uniref:toll-like receptor 4 n=1 Tax=Diadema setosum TaxID=31175 RepID=UPI003B3AA0CB
MIHLLELSLYSIELDRVTAGLFKNLSSLIRLDLSDNSLSTIRSGVFRPIKNSLQSIRLSDNPWNCDCRLRWLVEWLGEKTIRLENEAETICSKSGSIKTFQGKKLTSFDPGSQCGPNVILPCALVAAGISLLVLAILIFNKWSQMKYKFFILKLHFKGFKHIPDHDKRGNFRFDIGVLFHSDDEQWASGDLCRGLRETMSDYNRISLGDDDLPLGMFYLDAVHQVISHSFKIIFVISPTAIQDHMFMLKFRIAFDHYNEVLTEKILLVFLEDIPDDDLPFLIRLFLSDNRPYLRWTKDERDRPFFWDALAKYLTTNAKCNPLIPL